MENNESKLNKNVSNGRDEENLALSQTLSQTLKVAYVSPPPPLKLISIS